MISVYKSDALPTELYRQTAVYVPFLPFFGNTLNWYIPRIIPLYPVNSVQERNTGATRVYNLQTTLYCRFINIGECDETIS